MDGEAKAGGSVTSPPRGSGLVAAGWAAAAIIALIALLDIAIETFWSGSPLRWWIAPAAVIFVALSAWLWKPGEEAARRWGWEGAASWSIGGLLLLLAASSWFPEGQAHGVRMALQPTSVVLTVVTAAAVILAVAVLFRALSVLPSTARLVARAVVAVLGLYALASLGLALFERAPFASIFQGGAAWQRLPRWLQGAFVGAFVLLPLALAGQVIRVIDRLRRKQPVRVLLHQAMAIVMAVVMVTSGAVPPASSSATPGTAGPGSVSGSAPGASAAAPPGSVPEPVLVPLDVLRNDWLGGQDPATFTDRLFTAAEAELGRPGADPSDINAAAASLGRDPQKIFAFLRDQIITEPYVGMLRGARGTLAAGAGNALDRALLAQALLKASGTESRLVSGTLSSEHAQRLLNAYLAADPLKGPLASAATPQDKATLDATARAVAAQIGLSPDKAQEIVRRANAQSEVFWRATDDLRRTETEFLTGQLQRAGVSVVGGAGVSTAMLRERLAKHYWIQVKGTSGDWNDFDPSLPEARPGTAYADAAAPLAAIPRDAVHRFELSLVYRTGAIDVPSREVLLKADVPAADALFTPLAFQIQSADPGPDAGTLATMDAAQRIDRLQKMKRFQGIFQAGARVTGGREFDLEGHTYEAAGGGPSGKAVGDMFGGLFGGGGESTPGAFVDLQLVLKLSGPGRGPRTQTRTLVRAEDVKAPGFVPPLISAEILVQPQWIPQDLVTYQTLQSLVAFRGLVNEAMAASREGRAVRVPAQKVPPFPQHLLPLALSRQRAAAGILRAQPGVRALVDGALLTMANQRVSAIEAAAGEIRVSRDIDIVDNAVTLVGTDGSSNAATFAAALQLGVADCALESRFLQQTYPDDATVSGADIFDRARGEGRPVVVVGPQDGDALRRAGMGDADIEWIRANEDPGARLAVTSTASGAAGWWSVGPGGNSILRVSGGWGQAHSEESHLMVNIVKGAGFVGCALEVRHAAHAPSNVRGWGMASCLVLSTVSATFLMVGVHGGWVAALITFEVLNLVGTAIAADNERVRVIDLRK